MAGFKAAGNSGKLVSVDMPYVKRGNEPYVGSVVPPALHENWTLIREPDRNGIAKAIKLHGGRIDLCHYDSDKSWWGAAVCLSKNYGRRCVRTESSYQTIFRTISHSRGLSKTKKRRLR